MPEENHTSEADAEKLWKEYESCQETAQSLEKTIWQTSGVIGIGLVGTLVLVANHTKEEQPPWEIAAVIGLSIFFASAIWWFIARRWWSIQHAIFMRMRHIEEDLGIYRVRYLHYLDNPSALSKSDLSEGRVSELKERAEKGGLIPPHRRAGIQSFLWLLPVVIFVAWALYTLCLWLWRCK